MTSNYPIPVVRTALCSTLALCAVGSLFVGCDSPTQTGNLSQIVRPTLVGVDYGRLVDVFAYRRVDSSNPDRRDTRNRQPTLIQRDVVINAAIESQELFNAIGGEREGADFRFMPFNVEVGHDELLILWDDTDPVEVNRFNTAMTIATTNLSEVPPSFRTQETGLRPIPVVPKNAAICLRFDTDLGVTSAFFDANPNTVQLLEIIGDPSVANATASFRPADYRVLSQGNSLILDTTLIGAEAQGRRTSTGLAPSSDQVGANFRIALPTTGSASEQLRVAADVIPELNDVDAAGNQAVIRDFRSGNQQDGRVGALSDETPPTLVGRFEMGITEVDVANKVVTINKRSHLVALRGRIPFVDGAIDPITGVPGGRSAVPTVNTSLNRQPLASGDIVQQTVLSASGEQLRIIAEVVENLDVGSTLGDGNFAAPGLTAGGTDAGDLPVARLRLSTVSVFDSAGVEVPMVANASNPLGADCIVKAHYYESVPYSGEFGLTTSVSDRLRRSEFLLIDPPASPPPGSTVTPGAVRFMSPMSSLGLRFSEPMDLDSVDTMSNFFYATEEVDVSIVSDVLASPKSAGLSLLPSRVVDQDADGTVVKLLTPLGFYHETGSQELYWMHAMLDGVRDLAGNPLDLFDQRPPTNETVTILTSGGGTQPVSVSVPVRSFSVQFEMLSSGDTNRVATRSYRFEDPDEDGSPPGSVDMFGQFRIIDGKLLGADAIRTSANADQMQLSTVERFQRGECVVGTTNLGPVDPTHNGGLLYGWTGVPTNFEPVRANVPTIFPAQVFGWNVEPHVRRGSRMQITYREDDLGLDHHDANALNLDVEQMHWAPWNDGQPQFDVFDRYSMLLGHSDKRPDWLFYLDTAGPMPVCRLDCASLFSGLGTRFTDNVLEGSEQKVVVRPQRYTINPARAFRGGLANVKYVPYPDFDETYTWRDSRLVSWDMGSDRAVGLGGARDTFTPVPAGDRTASVSSPWGPDRPDMSVDGPIDPAWPFARFVRDTHDFLGDRTRDHDPIALPLLVEFRLFPDDTVNAASSTNVFWVGHVGPQYGGRAAPNGWYNSGGGVNTQTNDALHVGCMGVDWPFFRVQSTGGIDLLSNNDRLIFPDTTENAVGGLLKDHGVGRLPHDGLFQTKPGDGHIYWGQVDFIRRVSLVTFGFFDTLQPNQHAAPGNLPALPPASGRPNLTANAALGIQDLVVSLDPPQQTGGASVDVELRGVRQIGDGTAAPTIYDPLTEDLPALRGNLLNPNYACEAYRYALSNSTSGEQAPAPRVVASGFTPYVDVFDPAAIDAIRDPLTGRLPRFVNMRLAMNANIDGIISVPELRSMTVAYRLGEN